MVYSYLGALHMHTPYSDGSGTVPEIAEAARAAGLRWIIITDHDTLQALPEEGWYDGVAVLVGHEVTPDKNHLLVFGASEVISRDLSPAECIVRARELNALSFIAHPDERTNNSMKRPYEWEDWSIRGFTGIELWNYMSEWMEAITPWRKFLNFFFPATTIKGPTRRVLSWWDRLHREGERTVGVVGGDVHQARVRSLGRVWEVFPYEQVFRTLTNYLVLDRPLSEDFSSAKAQILEALGRGRVIMANRYYGQADGANFVARSGDKMATVGDTLAGGEQFLLSVYVPRRSDIRILRDGEVVCRRNDTNLLLTTHQPGNYRAEARRWGRTWILTNHIHVK